jgi:hypothetical protein
MAALTIAPTAFETFASIVMKGVIPEIIASKDEIKSDSITNSIIDPAISGAGVAAPVIRKKKNLKVMYDRLRVSSEHIGSASFAKLSLALATEIGRHAFAPHPKKFSIVIKDRLSYLLNTCWDIQNLIDTYPTMDADKNEQNGFMKLLKNGPRTYVAPSPKVERIPLGTANLQLIMQTMILRLNYIANKLFKNPKGNDFDIQFTDITYELRVFAAHIYAWTFVINDACVQQITGSINEALKVQRQLTVDTSIGAKAVSFDNEDDCDDIAGDGDIHDDIVDDHITYTYVVKNAKKNRGIIHDIKDTVPATTASVEAIIEASVEA